jgi:MarR family transcriptional regulator, organic hydroperoxide resistance regulator
MRLLWAVAHGLDSTSKRMRAELGVTGPQRLVLRLVGHYGELSPGALAELLHIDPSSLTGILQRLESAGLLRRVSDPADGRRAILTLRKKGRDLNIRRGRTVEESVRRALSSLSRAKIAAARDVLKTLADELDNTPSKSSKERRSYKQRRATG